MANIFTFLGFDHIYVHPEMEANLMCACEICEMRVRKLVRGWRAGSLMVGGGDLSTELNYLI